MKNVTRDGLPLRSPRLCVRNPLQFSRRGAESAEERKTQFAFVVVLLLCVMFCRSVVAQEEPDATAEAAEFLKAARANIALITIQQAKTGAKIDPVENPVFRYKDLARGSAQGTVWIWGRTGRPAAVLEMIRHADNSDWFCFHATTDEPIKLTAKTGQTWTPKSSDLKFRLLPGAPTPSDSPAGRFRQMKAFSRQFTAHEFWENARHEMRILPVPLHRYEDRDQKLLDGAVFGIVLGTHPEATLFLEAIQPADESKPVWHFAVGRSGAAEMVVNYEDKEVHHMPLIETFPPSTNTYWRMILKAEGK